MSFEPTGCGGHLTVKKLKQNDRGSSNSQRHSEFESVGYKKACEKGINQTNKNKEKERERSRIEICINW